MSIRFFDSFDGYNTSQINRKWTTISTAGSPGPVISSSAGRFGSSGLVINDFGSIGSSIGGYVAMTLGPQSTWIVGVAFRMVTNASGVFPISFFDVGTLQCGLRVNTDNTLSVVNGSGTVLGTTVASIQTDIYAYLEIKATIGSSGSYELRINGQTVLTGTGVDTDNSGNNTANVISLGAGLGLVTNIDCYFDDVYICDATGSTNNNFLGDVHVELLLPNGVGNSSQWDRIDQAAVATQNYQVVDERPPNDDQDYVQTDVVGRKDTYQFTDLQLVAGTIYGVQVNMCARHANAGASLLAAVVRHNSTDHIGTGQALDGDYSYVRQIYEQNPGTVAAWTVSDVNNAEFGIQLASAGEALPAGVANNQGSGSSSTTSFSGDVGNFAPDFNPDYTPWVNPQI